MSNNDLQVGMSMSDTFWHQPFDERVELMGSVAAAGVNHVYLADHVSFRDGSGMDGFVTAAALSQLHPDLRAMIAIYLLPLRHPVPVARQLATMAQVSNGRIIFGIGIGGEDRHEVESCEVDPRTRGKRCDESLEIVRALMAGETLDFHGRFYNLDQVRIKPTPREPVPIIVGGRSDAAVQRAARFGDGWLATWCSPQRYESALGQLGVAAEAAGRQNVAWQHGYQLWCGIGDSKDEARSRVAQRMEKFYKIPFAGFEKYTPYGTPADIAEALVPYVEQGCRILNITPCGGSEADNIAAVGEIRQILDNR